MPEMGPEYFVEQVRGANRRLDHANANLLPHTRYFYTFDHTLRRLTLDGPPDACDVFC